MKRIQEAVLGLCVASSWSATVAGVDPGTQTGVGESGDKRVRWHHISTVGGDIPPSGQGNEQTALIAADLDGNGSVDAVVADRTKSPALVWYRYAGPGWDRYMIDDEMLRIEAGGVAADLDGDGDLDIVHGGDSKSNEVWWWENPSPEFSPNVPWRRRMIKSTGGNQHHDQAVGDFDGDGKPELVFWNQRVRKLFLADVPETLKGAGEWGLQEIFSWPKAFKYEGMAVNDIDGDGAVDLVCGGMWFGFSGGEVVRHVVDEAYGSSRSSSADLIKGGRPEIILSSGDTMGPLNIYEYQDGNWVKRTLIDRVDHGHSLDVGDVDGDGSLDIYAAEMHTPGAMDGCRQWVLYGDGKGGFEIQLLSTGIGNHESRLGDLDGDGDLDILGKPYTWSAPRVDFWLNEGRRQVASQKENVMNHSLQAGPQPGDVYREHRWFNEQGDAGQTLRVGTRGIDADYATDSFMPDWDVDLEHATSAELVLEKILCHDGTVGLAVQLNDGEWLAVPEAGGIPEQPEKYQHHTYPIVSVPLGQLRAGKKNAFRMRVAPEHPWNWPQNLINGVHLRVYYDSEYKAHATGRLAGVSEGGTINDRLALSCDATSPNGPIVSVDYVGFYTDVNFEGDGFYRQWHGHYDHGRFVHHIGSATEAPFAAVWDTLWVPDQAAPMQLSARVTDAAGITAMLPAVGGLTLERPGFSVELCELRNVPTRWVTRRGEISESFVVRGDLSKAMGAQLVWCSWSPGYMEGILINGTKVFGSEGPRYAAFWHRVEVDDLSPLQAGENRLTTVETPEHNGKMVHGMEVNWPGIMVLVKYRTDRLGGQTDEALDP